MIVVIVQQWWYPVHIPDPCSKTLKHINNNNGISWVEQGNSHIAQVQATLLHYLRLTIWVSLVGKMMVMSHKTHAPPVHHHKCSRLWSCSPSPSNTGILSQPLSLQYGYHKYERQWFIITSVQGHGHVTQVPATQVPYHNLLDYSMDITNVQTL